MSDQTTDQLLKLISQLPPAMRLGLLEKIKDKDKANAIDRFKPEKILFDKQVEVISSQSTNKVLTCSRRCLAEGTLIKTVNRGLVPIQCVKEGDLVYGVNMDGSIGSARVLRLFDNGVKDSVTMSCSSDVIDVTPDHRFLVENIRKPGQPYELEAGKLYSGIKVIKKRPVDFNYGYDESEAYIIGYVQGNGCMTCSYPNILKVSSNEENCVRKIAEYYGCLYEASHETNYTWNIRAGKDRLERIYLRFLGKYSHEKHIDYKEVQYWNMESKLELLAGLLDSDGCLCLADGGVELSFGCQSQQTAETFSMLLLELFNAVTNLCLDNRAKYKHGPIYRVRLKGTASIKEVMTALQGRTQRVKMQDEWWSLPEQRRTDRVGYKVAQGTPKRMYDISIDNATNLYLLGNGAVTHNCGKTYFIAVKLLLTAMINPRSVSLYVGLTKGAAKRVIWDTIVNLVEDYGLPCKYNNHTLEVEFDNRSKVYIDGAKDANSVERMRGMALHLAILDEAQGFPVAFACSLVAEILQPSLRDHNGELILAGTPDPICKSVLYLAWKGETPFKNYEKFHWNVTHNSKFPRFVSGLSTPETYLQEICDDTGYKMTDPGFRREYLGEFVEDKGALVYGFEAGRDLAESLPPGHEWKYVVSCDIGSKDADAIVAAAFSPTHPIAYVVECFSKSGQDVTTLCQQIKDFNARYKPIVILMDYAGGGAKVIDELNSRYSLAVRPAEKYNPKASGALLVQDEFRKGTLKIIDNPENEALISQLENITWIRKKDRNGNDVRVIPDGRQVTDSQGQVVSDDAADSFLYLFRYLRNYAAITPSHLSPAEQQALMLKQHKQHILNKPKVFDDFLSDGQKNTDWF